MGFDFKNSEIQNYVGNGDMQSFALYCLQIEQKASELKSQNKTKNSEIKIDGVVTQSELFAAVNSNPGFAQNPHYELLEDLVKRPPISAVLFSPIADFDFATQDLHIKGPSDVIQLKAPPENLPSHTQDEREIADWILRSYAEDQSLLTAAESTFDDVRAQALMVQDHQDVQRLQSLYPDAHVSTYGIAKPFNRIVPGMFGETLVAVHIFYKVETRQGATHYFLPAGLGGNLLRVGRDDVFEMNNCVLELDSSNVLKNHRLLNAGLGAEKLATITNHAQARVNLARFHVQSQSAVTNKPEMNLQSFVAACDATAAEFQEQRISALKASMGSMAAVVVNSIVAQARAENAIVANRQSKMRAILQAKKQDHPNWNFDEFFKIPSQYIDQETGIAVEPALFCGIVTVDGVQKVVILDLKDGAIYQSTQSLGDTDVQTLFLEAMDAFVEGNEYGIGYLTYATPDPLAKGRRDQRSILTVKCGNGWRKLWQGVDAAASYSGLAAIGLMAIPAPDLYKFVACAASLTLSAASSVYKLANNFYYEREVSSWDTILEVANLLSVTLGATAVGSRFLTTYTAANQSEITAIRLKLWPHLAKLEKYNSTLAAFALTTDGISVASLTATLYEDLDIDNPSLSDEQRAERLRFLIQQVGVQAVMVLYFNRQEIKGAMASIGAAKLNGLTLHATKDTGRLMPGRYTIEVAPQNQKVGAAVKRGDAKTHPSGDDYVFVKDNFKLGDGDSYTVMSVADGASCYEGAIEASRQATQRFYQFLDARKSTIRNDADLIAQMQLAAKDVHATLRSAGMPSTTLVFSVTNQRTGKTFIFYQGDSRAYLMKSSALAGFSAEQLTSDSDVRLGTSREELGAFNDVIVVQLERGDRLLLATDATHIMTDDEMVQHAADANPNVAAQNLADAVPKYEYVGSGTFDDAGIVIFDF